MADPGTYNDLVQSVPYLHEVISEMCDTLISQTGCVVGLGVG